MPVVFPPPRLSRGFTLLELTVVMAVALTVAFVTFRVSADEHLRLQTRDAADHLSAVGAGVASYILLHADALAANETTELPVTALQEANSCGAIPCLSPGALLTSPIGSGYAPIRIRRLETTPLRFDALVLTTGSWYTGAATCRLDLIGQAARQGTPLLWGPARANGIFGMTNCLGLPEVRAEGVSLTWGSAPSLSATDFPAIDTTGCGGQGGQLAFYVTASP